MSVPEVEQLLYLVRRMDGTTAPGDVARRAVEALNIVRRVADELCARRDEAICALYRSGESLQDIREQTGLSRARVHQIIQASQQPRGHRARALLPPS